jgi:hypothetical protein
MLYVDRSQGFTDASELLPIRTQIIMVLISTEITILQPSRKRTREKMSRERERSFHVKWDVNTATRPRLTRISDNAEQEGEITYSLH